MDLTLISHALLWVAFVFLLLTSLPRRRRASAARPGMDERRIGPAFGSVVRPRLFAAAGGRDALFPPRDAPAALLFLSTHCPECQRLRPVVRRIAHVPGATALTVVLGGTLDDLPAWSSDYSGTGTTLIIDPTLAIMRQFGVSHTPSVILISPDGRCCGTMLVRDGEQLRWALGLIGSLRPDITFLRATLPAARRGADSTT